MKAKLFKTKSEAKAWKQSEEDYGLTCVIEDYNGKYLVECRKQQNEFGVTSTSEGADRDYDSTTTSKQQKEYIGDLFKFEPKSGFLYRATEVDEDDNPVRYEFAGKMINNVEPKKQQKDISYWIRRLSLAVESLTEESKPYRMDHNDGGELTSFEEGATKPGALLRIALALEKIAEKTR